MKLGKFDIGLKITEVSPKDRLKQKARKLTHKIMRGSYRDATQHVHLDALMGGIKDELQQEFREDNLPTTVCFMIESILDSSGLDENDSLYKKLKDIVK